MKRIPTMLFSTVLAGLLLLFVGWGSSGHSRINTNASLSFSQQMQQFQAWTTSLAQHASDADDRKATDPSEAPKHYIDLDNYPGFLSSFQIPQSLDSAIEQQGAAFVYENGILPWATLTCFDSLTSCFSRRDWDKAMLFAADLGHYVADGHMPLHLCRNYDGQFTGNTGIHSRYESSMVNYFLSSIQYSGDSLHLVSNVSQFVFSYLYQNFVYSDSVIVADDYARTITTDFYSQAYKQALWDKTGVFTIELFKKASNRLASLMYTAWVLAGSPLIQEPNGIIRSQPGGYVPSVVRPNPFLQHTKIYYGLTETSNVRIHILDLNGKTVEILQDGLQGPGFHFCFWDASAYPQGVYYLSLFDGKNLRTEKLLHLNP